MLSHTEIDLKEWQRFISIHPESTFFHTPEYYFAFQTDEHAKTHLIAILSERNEILALSVFVIYKEKGIKRYFSRRAIFMSSPIVKGNDVELFNILLEAQDYFLKNKVIYSEIRNIASTVFLDVIKREGYNIKDHLNIVINLQKNLSDLYSGISSSARNKIRKAEKLQLQFSELRTSNDIEKTYGLLQLVYDRINYPLLSYSVFKEMCEYLLKEAKMNIFEVFSNNDLVSVMLLPQYKNSWYCWYSGTLRNKKLHGTSDFLVWNIFQEAKKKGIEQFDWGGAGNPGTEYGVRNFKKKFGGQLIKQHRATCVYKPILYRFSNFAFRLYRSINKKVCPK